MQSSPNAAALFSALQLICRDVVGPAAVQVDRDSVFPTDSSAAVRSAVLLGALVPTTYGGGGCSYAEISAMCTELGRSCGSTAMVFAMHQIQVACVVEHCQGQPHFDEFLTEIASQGRLIASATSEAGVGGDVRSSVCAVEVSGDKFALEKNATVISYGDYVHDILVTARRNTEAAASDQVIVHVQRPLLELEPRGTWDAFGMRGTCSIGYLLRATGAVDQIVPHSYSDVSERTMLPVTHILWSSLWLGIADDAMDKARIFVRTAARKSPGVTPPGARHLAVAQAALDAMRAGVLVALDEYEAVRRDPEVASTLSFAIRMNELKLTASVAVVQIVQAAMNVCGIAAYRNDTPFSLGRHLRDAHSAAVMVHNDRIIEHNASLLCVAKEI